jgi:hypothetical protein
MENCGRSKQAGYDAYWRCVHLRAGKSIQLLEGVRGVGGRWEQGIEIGGLVAACVLAKGEEAFPDSRHSTTIVSLCLDVISRIEMQIICRRIQNATSAYL